jgi:predicted nucleic acid-binding protein
MADAMVYATAQAYGAVLVTGDRHFAGLPGVECLTWPAP